MNKSFKKRFRETPSGKFMSRRPGQNHFNAKARRVKQLERNRMRELEVRSKELKEYSRV